MSLPLLRPLRKWSSSSLSRSAYFGNRCGHESRVPALRLQPRGVRLVSSGANASRDKAVGNAAHASERQKEAARTHKEIQNLLQRNPPSSSTPSSQSPSTMSSLTGNEGSLAYLHQLREKQREQSRRQAIINSVLSFLMVVLAAQGAKNGQERREAQEGRRQAEEQLLKVRSDVRNVVESDEFLSQLAHDCIQASDDTRSNFDGKLSWTNWIGARATSQSSHEVYKDARVERVVASLRQGLATQLTSVVLSDDERERQEMDQLAKIALSAIASPEVAASTMEAVVHSALPSAPAPHPPSGNDADTSSQPNVGPEAKKVFIL